MSNCQFGNHGEPFLWFGSGNDEIDIATIELIQLVELDKQMALEIADEIGACLSHCRTMVHAQGQPEADIQRMAQASSTDEAGR